MDAREQLDKIETRRLRADYGLDAPGAVRNLLLVAGIGAGALIARLLGLWNEQMRSAWVFFWIMGAGFGCLISSVGMIYSSRVGKLRMRDRHLNSIPWSGDERVLDVGCGRGLMLMGAARRLKSGKAVGIDIWNAQDLSGNTAQAARRNARAEGVADRVEIVDADARALPFPDSSIDVVLSSTALHNIADASQRDHAVREIARVLKPGGRAIISDIRHVPRYADVLRAAGCEAEVHSSALHRVVFPLMTMGAVRPGHVIARKPGVSPISS